MRIITGRYKSRLFKMPKGIRPTQDKVRKALFDVLGDIEGLSFLDLFAGSGAVGLEAASRGAKEAVFVEQDPACTKAIENSLTLLGYAQAEVIRLDAFKAIERFHKQRRTFDLIFLDPPYYHDLPKKTLQILGAYDILARNGFVIVQHFRKDNLPVEAGDLRLFRQPRYGDTLLSFYRKK